MNTKRFLLGLVMAVAAQVSWGQALSDEEVLAMGRRLKAGGDSNITVTTKVLQAGATREQLMRIAEAQKTTATATAGSTAGDADRTNNGEIVEFTVPAQDDDARKVFGRNIFRTRELSFEPNSSIAIGSDYVVGPGDELIVDIAGASQSSNRYKINPEGKITIPRIGPIYVSGMSVESAQSRIWAAMGQHYQNSTMKLSVGQTRSITVNIMGEVRTPGTYKLSAFATVFHALYQAGGTSAMGTLRDIKVARNGRIISTIDVYEYILNGRLAGDVKLQDNDVIMVSPYVNLVNISGSVRRPMWYEMKKGETISTLLNFAGGLTGDAYGKSITVRRSAGDRLSVNTVDEFDFATFVLTDEDMVSVRGNEDRYENVVNVSGAVLRPGSYELQKISTLRELLEAAGGLREEAKTDRAIITRLNDDRTRQTLAFEPAAILDGSAPDIVLKNEDNVVIASMAEFNDNRYMQITGEVQRPDKFPFATNTTLEDLITLAGGLTEGASMTNVEIARRIIDPKATTDAETRTETFNFALIDGTDLPNGMKFEIKPYDHVYIRRSPVFNTQHSVSIMGEVMYAGTYVLENQTTRLSDIVKRAGGLKRNSSAHSARVIRQMNQDEIARERELISLAQSSADSLHVSNYSLRTSYTVGIDMEKALKHPGGADDIVMRDNDQIIVPMLNNTVKINGAVLFPNTVTYDKSKSYRSYINEAGGYTKESLRRKAYIVYANGHVAKARKGKVEPGCEIVVPTKPERTVDPLTSASKWISITSALSTAAAVVITMFKK